MKKENLISAEEFDRKFDDGEDISEYVDFESVRSIHAEQKPGSLKS